MASRCVRLGMQLKWLMAGLVLLPLNSFATCPFPVYKVDYLLDLKMAGKLKTPSPTGSSSAQSFERSSIEDVTEDSLRALIEVQSRLANANSIFPPIGVCVNGEPGAQALPSGVISRDGVVIFSTGMMRMLGADRDALASVMAHEFAHISEQHSKQKIAFQQQANAVGVNAGVSVAMTTGSVAAGILVAKQESLKLSRAFSRSIEMAADDVGYRLYIAAGFDPTKVTGPMRLMESRRGSHETRIFDTHPALAERIARLDELARNDVERVQRVATAQAQAAANGPYVAKANELWGQRRYRELTAYVRSWLTDLPESSSAWYFRGLLLHRNGATRPVAWEAFERAVNFDPNFSPAWEELCGSLHETGHRAESATCISAMRYIGHDVEALQEGPWGNRLWVGGRPLEISGLWWGRTASGSRLITNIKPSGASNDLTLTSIPPKWKPLVR